MDNIAQRFHQTAMDLYDLGRIYKAKGQPQFYEGNLELAFVLDKEAALRVQAETQEVLWKAVYPRSAGWLAFKNGKYLEARQLAELGLSHREDIPAYEVQQLQELMDVVNEKIITLPLAPENNSDKTIITGIIAVANMDENKIQIRATDGKNLKDIQVATSEMVRIARLFLGETVKASVRKGKTGQLFLEDIRRAA